MKLRLIQLLSILAAGTLLWGCNNAEQQQQPPQVATTQQEEALPPEGELLAEDDYWAKDNFDLQRVGPILRRSRNVEEFERYLNEDDGVNNLDLNGDGYADYISVDEYGYEDPNQRGLSLYSRFGPDLVQEIARVIFYRDQPNYPGSRVMLYGDEHIYGDDHYYETNWLDQTIGIVSAIFGGREPYRSPYYYDNYPDWYEPYYIVETPVYRTRVVQLYPDPLFVYTTEPTFIDRVSIRSPYDGRWIDRVYARLAKPTREQEQFLRSNRVPPARGRRDMADGPGFSEDAPGQRKKVEGRQSANPGRGNPDPGKPDRGNPDKPDKPEKADKNQGGPPRDNPAKGNPNKPDKPQNAGNPNKGGGNPNKGGGDNGKGGGKGKGKP